jgi:hypothetical protein
MIPYLTLLTLILLPYLLGVHLLVVPALFVFRRRFATGVLTAFLCSVAAGSPLSTLYVWAALGEFSNLSLVIIGALSLYTGLVAAIWLTLLEHRGNRKAKPLNKSLNSDAGKAGAG